jgi:hypothetical protein
MTSRCNKGEHEASNGQDDGSRRHQTEDAGPLGHVLTAAATRAREEQQGDRPSRRGGHGEGQREVLVNAVEWPQVTQEHRDADHDGETGAVPGEGGAFVGETSSCLLRCPRHRTVNRFRRR